MKQFNDITIIGIDQGYGNMKTANTIFPTAITAYDTAPMFKGDVLEYGGKFYRVGEGHKGFVADKSTDGDFYLLTLAAIAKELEQYRLFTASLCLSVGLPLSWVGSQRESFRQYLMQNETIRFRFNGNLFQLRIVGCKVYPQGYAAIVQQLADFEGEHLLADIGNGTMNLLYLTDSQPQESRCWTEKIGVNQCMIRAKEAVLRRFGSKISDSTVERSTLLVAKAASPLYCWLKMDATAPTGIAKPMMSTFSSMEKSPAHSLPTRSVSTGTISSLTKQIA